MTPERKRRYEAGPGFVRAKECPDCGHTRCGEDCVCNCDAAHAEHEAAYLRTALDEARASIPPAIVAALYPGQPDAQPSVEDVCAEIEGLRETSQPPRAVRLKSELRALTFYRKAGHEEDDHDHIMVGDVEVARVEYGETDAEGRGVGDDIGPADVDAWFATPSPTPAPTNTAEVVRTIVARLREMAAGHWAAAQKAEGTSAVVYKHTCQDLAVAFRAAADSIERDHAPSVPVERGWWPVSAEIDRLAALLEAGTPGPWHHSRPTDEEVADDDVRVCYLRDGKHCEWCIALAGNTIDGETWDAETLGRWHADAALIVAAVNALPRLLAVARAVEAYLSARVADEDRALQWGRSPDDASADPARVALRAALAALFEHARVPTRD